MSESTPDESIPRFLPAPLRTTLRRARVWLAPQHTRSWPLTPSAVALVAGVAFVLLLFTPIRGEWALFHLVAGDPLSPYDYNYAYPPWLALLLYPFSLLPFTVARALFGAFSVAATGYAIDRLGGGFFQFLAVLLSPFAAAVLVRGQVDVLPLLGLALGLHPVAGVQLLGLVFLGAKPQVLGLAAPVILWHAPQRRQLLLGVGVFLLGTLLLYGFWPAAMVGEIPHLYRADSVAPWPYGAPLGTALFLYALLRRRPAVAGVSTLLLVPYLNWYSLLPPFAILCAGVPARLAFLLLAAAWGGMVLIV